MNVSLTYPTLVSGVRNPPCAPQLQNTFAKNVEKERPVSPNFPELSVRRELSLVSKWVTKLSTTVFWQYGRGQRAPLMKWSWRSPGRFPVTADGRSATERRCCCQGGCPSSLSPSPLRCPSPPPPPLYYKTIFTRDS